jgi:hypothetical protein
MLIQKKFEANIGDVVTVRLITGDEVVGRITATDATSVSITKPVMIIPQMTNDGKVRLQMVPFNVSTDEADEYRIETSKTLLPPMKPRKEVSDNYLAATTGIVPASAGSILRA